MADRLCGNIPVDIAAEMARMDYNVMEEKHVGDDYRSSCNGHVAGTGRYFVCVCMRHDWLDDIHNTERRR